MNKFEQFMMDWVIPALIFFVAFYVFIYVF